MTDHTDLIARLREAAEEIGDDDFSSAADALEALRAENERLRQALRYYADGYYVGDGDCNGYVMPQDLKGAGDTGEIARAALAR